MMLDHLSKSFLVQQGSLGLVLCFGERRKRCEGGHPMREGKDPCGSIIVFNSNTVQRYHVLHLFESSLTHSILQFLASMQSRREKREYVFSKTKCLI